VIVSRPTDARQAQFTDVNNRFSFHPATEVTGPIHDQVRDEHLGVAEWILDNVPAGRHQSLALTALQESMMWCNAAVACDTKPGAVIPPIVIPPIEPTSERF
jgi:hypothetical protein